MPQFFVSSLSVERSSSLIRLRSLAVRRLQSERADDVTQRGAREIHDLDLIAVDVVLRALDALLVFLDLEVDLRVDAGVQVVVRDDLLRLGIDHLLGDVDLDQVVDERNDPVEARPSEPLVLAEPLDERAVGWPNDPNSHEEDEHSGSHPNDDPEAVHEILPFLKKHPRHARGSATNRAPAHRVQQRAIP
jgi:hypothetical protein